MPLRNVVLVAAVLLSAFSNSGSAQSIRRPPSLPDTLGRSPLVLLAPRITGSAFQVADTARERRYKLRGAIAGGFLGGVAAAGYSLNATAQDCISNAISTSCKGGMSTFTVVTITVFGIVGGWFLGGWLGEKLAR